MRLRKRFGGILIGCLSLIVVLRYSLLTTTSNEGPPFPKKNNFRPSQTSKHAIQVQKHDVINFKGFASNHSSIITSKEQTTMMLVWPKINEVISRSDTLPDMSEGVRDASIAFKQLLAAIEEEKRSTINHTKPNCPFALNLENGTLLQNGSFLAIPCGLVQDSSISLVGVPNDDPGSFHIQLIGTQHQGEKRSPVLLHYDVRLQGAKQTEGPVIVQNTWNELQGWGVEERCPFQEPASNHTVDGLYICSEQSNAGSGKNRSQKYMGEEKLLNSSRRSSDERINFPFVIGYPFTATLWTGFEGFHMTIDGKLFTSFAYRENSELWLVSGVKIGGGLNIISAIANGLPVVELLDTLDELDYLKAPPISKKRILLLVGISSSANNFDRRMAIRRSWMQYENIRSGEVAVRFFVALHKNLEVNLELWNEAKAYGDIQIMPFVDYYNLITLKTIAMCIFGAKILPAKYIMKTDDDAFLRIDQILTRLKETKISSGLLYGQIAYDSQPIRDLDSKWYISNEEWPHETYPPWAHGPGYIICRDIAKFVVRGHQERKLQLFKLENVAMGIWIQQFEKSGQRVHYINDDDFHNAGCEQEYVLAHYQGPRLMLCLWQKLQEEHEAICCE